MRGCSVIRVWCVSCYVFSEHGWPRTAGRLKRRRSIVWHEGQREALRSLAGRPQDRLPAIDGLLGQSKFWDEVIRCVQKDVLCRIQAGCKTSAITVGSDKTLNHVAEFLTFFHKDGTDANTHWSRVNWHRQSSRWSRGWRQHKLRHRQALQRLQQNLHMTHACDRRGRRIRHAFCNAPRGEPSPCAVVAIHVEDSEVREHSLFQSRQFEYRDHLRRTV